jgi:hypothetical protein
MSRRAKFITTQTIRPSSSYVLVASVHHSESAARRTGRAVLELADGPWGGRDPVVGDPVGLFSEGNSRYAVRPRKGS